MARKLNRKEAQEFAATIERERAAALGVADRLAQRSTEWTESEEHPARKSGEWPAFLTFGPPASESE